MSSANDIQQQGIRLFREHEYEQAAERFNQARELYDAEGKPDMAAEMLVNTGLVQRALGDYDQAAALMQQALDVFNDMQDQKRAAQVLGNLGGVFAAQGDQEQAITCYRQAADVFKMLGEDKLYGETLLALGDLQVRSGQVMSGAASYEAGLENLDELSGSQKVLKGLLSIKNRLTGGSPSGGSGG